MSAQCVCLVRADVFPSVRVRKIRERERWMEEGRERGGEEKQGVTAGKRRQRLR